MIQSYVIFVNNSKIVLHNNEDKIPENAVVIHEPNEYEILTNVEFLENSNYKALLVFTHSNVKNLHEIFFSQFKIISAAGGMVFNDKNECLMIFRRKKWDLPKGKVEKKETLEEAAIREVKEETGIADISIDKKLDSTYHIYTLKGKKILKESHWYMMKSEFKGVLKPQIEEDIDEVKWIPMHDIRTYVEQSFENIKRLFELDEVKKKLQED